MTSRKKWNSPIYSPLLNPSHLQIFRYAKDFKPVERALYTILTNSYTKIDFAEPLLELMNKKFQCDLGKLNSFAETIFLMAREGQQVVVTYHKLTGSNTSVVTSVEEWLDMVYSVRNKLYDEKNRCYRQISSYITKDIDDIKYQEGGNDDAFSRLNRIILSKYSWFGWVSEFKRISWKNKREN